MLHWRVLFWSKAIPAWIVMATVCMAGDWPEFRGPTGQGHVADQGLPLTWSETENVVWKVPVPGLGWSSPVIQGDQIWLTTATDENRSLRALCYDRRDGSLLHDVEVFYLEEPGKVHQKNSHASPTPIVEGDRVYVHFGGHGTGCLSTSGELIWTTQENKYDHRHGPGGSPILCGDLLFFSCDGYDAQFVVALDKRTGKIVWKKERPSRHAYSTPLLVEFEGKSQIISTGADATVAYDPATGEELWRCTYDGYSLIPRPVTGDGMVFLCTGYNEPTVLGVRLGGSGDVTDTHVVWTLKRNAPHSPSPLLHDGLLYVMSDRGIATCVDAHDGTVVWQERIGGNFSASPVMADGRIYLLDEAGVCTVFKPGKTYEHLATNEVSGRTLASLAAKDRAFYLRTDTHLYRIEEKP